MQRNAIFRTGACVAICCLATLAAHGESKTWKKHQAAGEKALKAHNTMEAEEQFRRAVAEAEPLDESKLRESLEDLAPLLMSHRKFDDAQRAYERLCQLFEKELGSNHVRVGMCLLGLGQAYAYGKKLFEAESALLRAQWIINRKAEANDPARAHVKGGLAFVHTEQGRYAEAEGLYRSAIEHAETPRVRTKYYADGSIQRLRYTPPYELIGGLRNDLGMLYAKQGKLGEAEEAFKRAQKVFATGGRESSGVAMALGNLGHLYLAQKKYAEAEEALSRSLAIREKRFGARHPIIAETLEVLAQAQEARSPESAALSRRRAQEIRGANR